MSLENKLKLLTTPLNREFILWSRYRISGQTKSAKKS